MTDTLRVFAYGSLMYAPECPEHVGSIVEAELLGHCRAFNKRSYVRGCAPEARLWPDLEVPDGFATSKRQFSLALGTEAGDRMIGRVVHYAADATDEVLRRLDIREGYDVGQPIEKSGYLRCISDVVISDNPTTAHAYLGNPDSELHTPLTLHEQARVLIAATPHGEAQQKLAGLEYLIGARRTLAEGGIVDPHLEELWSTVRDLPGPWQDWLETHA